MVVYAAAILFPAVVAALMLSPVPRHPYQLDETLSDKTVLLYARENNLQFGKDLVVTYGPLGFLSSPYFFPNHPKGPRLSVLALCLGVALGVRLIARRLSWFPKLLLWAVFLFLACNIEPRIDLLVYEGILCWALLCLVHSGWRLLICGSALALLCTFAALLKANFIYLTGFTGLAVIALLLVRKERKAALAFPIAFALSFLAAWLLLGQHLQTLPRYFQNSYSIIHGYDQGVAMKGIEILFSRGLFTLLLTLGVVACASLVLSGSKLLRTIIALWLAGFTWMVWKHAFVRADLLHVSVFLGFAPLIPLTLQMFPSLPLPARRWGRVAGVLCCLVPIFTLQSLSFASLGASLRQPLSAFGSNLQVLFRPDRYETEMKRAFNDLVQETSLPHCRELIGSASVDVFGQNQAYAILNHLRYTPRPVFQSFMAYNRFLMGLNNKLYAGEAAPEYVLFDLHPVDHKFPPLEDAQVLRTLLLRYQPVLAEKGFLLLRKQAAAPVALEWLQTGRLRAGERIELQPFASNELWLELTLTPSWMGRMKQCAFKSSIPQVLVWAADVLKPQHFRAPAPMLEAGFMASPLLLQTRDVEHFSTTNSVTRPVAYGFRIEPGEERMWQPTATYRLYRNAAR